MEKMKLVFFFTYFYIFANYFSKNDKIKVIMPKDNCVLEGKIIHLSSISNNESKIGIEFLNVKSLKQYKGLLMDDFFI